MTATPDDILADMDDVLTDWEGSRDAAVWCDDGSHQEDERSPYPPGPTYISFPTSDGGWVVYLWDPHDHYANRMFLDDGVGGLTARFTVNPT